jgi:hypothetical protein
VPSVTVGVHFHSESRELVFFASSSELAFVMAGNSLRKQNQASNYMYMGMEMGRVKEINSNRDGDVDSKEESDKFLHKLSLI